MDIADRAEDQIEAQLAANLSHAHRVSPTGGQEFDGLGRVICLDCAAPIAPARLNAVPGACRCVECQAIAERSA